jgi:tetratricopeptide (TPR) repeat protein/4-amino-4-deoxy-L-arabinose transferase-like glycosyltransferase
MRSTLSHRREETALAVLIVVVILINLTWLWQDTRPQPEVDPHVYLIRTFKFVAQLGEGEGSNFWKLIDQMSFQGRPPLYQLLSLPAILLLGHSEDAAVLVNLLFTVILLLCTYSLAKLASNGKAGLLAAFILATYPPIVQLTRIYRPHSALPACVALSMWLLLLLMRTRAVKIAWFFGLSFAFGMLIHLNFAYAMLAPTLLLGCYMLLFQNEPRLPPSLQATPSWLLGKLNDRFVLFGLLPAMLFAALITLGWYLPHINSILELGRAVRIEFGLATRGFYYIPRSFWWYALSAPGALSNALALMFVVGLAVCVARRRMGPLVLVTAFVLIYIAFAQRPGDLGWLHASALLPVAAAITGVGLVELRYLRLGMGTRVSHLLSNGLVWGAVAIAAFNFSFVTWELGTWSKSVASALGSQHEKAMCTFRMNVIFCSFPAREEEWHVDDFLKIILNDPECEQRQCTLTVVPDHDYFNIATFESTMVRAYPTSRQNLQLKEPGGWRVGLGDGEWILSEYLAFISGIRYRGRDRDVRTEITRLLQSQQPVFANKQVEVVSLPLPDDWTASLIKRTEALTVEEESQLYEEAVRAVPSDVSLLRKLGHLALRTGEWPRAEDAFLEAVEIDPGLGWAHVVLGWLYQQQGLDDEAVIQYRNAIESEPFDPQAYRKLSNLLISRGDAQEAVAVYELAAKNNPGFAWPLLELGEMYVWADQIPNARATFQQAATMDPWNQEAREQANNAYWSLATGLALAQAEAGDTELGWVHNAGWAKPYPDDEAVLAGPSELSVGGKVQPDQIHLHPFSAGQSTSLTLDVEDSHYNELNVGYGLADEVAGLSDGVGFQILVTAESAEQPVVLMDETVNSNVWEWQKLPLVAFYGQDLVLHLKVDALGDDSYDWLQAAVRIVPAAE